MENEIKVAESKNAEGRKVVEVEIIKPWGMGNYEAKIVPAEGHEANGKEVIDRWMVLTPERFQVGYDSVLNMAFLGDRSPISNKVFDSERKAISYAKRLVKLAAE